MARPESGETFVQFLSRSKRYLERWFELGKVDRTYEGIVDFLLRDQMLSTCSRDLYVFLKEKSFNEAHEMAVQADFFADARGGTKYVLPRESRDRVRSENRSTGMERRARGQGEKYRGYDRARDYQRDRGGDRSRDRSKERVRGNDRSVTCYHCGAQGHIAPECPRKSQVHRAAALDESVTGGSYSKKVSL